MRRQFQKNFRQIQAEFNAVFNELFGGGVADLQLVREEGQDLLDSGVTVIAQPPGKKLQNMMQLSGGEKALTAIALLFAIQNLKPSPFCLVDEIEAALDEPNVDRFAGYLKRLKGNTQIIAITHRRGTMQAAETPVRHHHAGKGREHTGIRGSFGSAVQRLTGPYTGGIPWLVSLRN